MRITLVDRLLANLRTVALIPVVQHPNLPRPVCGASVSKSMASHQIVVVEDDPIIAADLAERICDLGYGRPATFARGEDALEAILAQTPQLVLMDVQLAGDLDGIDTVARFRESCPDAAVVFLTSNTDEATFARARKLHPRAFLGKPFRARDLRNTIELAIGSPPPPVNEGSDGEDVYRLQDRLFVKVKDRLHRVLISDILWVQADDYYCRIVTKDKDYLVTRTLKKFAELLPEDGPFVRTHRSYIINLRHVEEIAYAFVQIDGRRVPVSKSSREDLMKALKNA